MEQKEEILEGAQQKKPMGVTFYPDLAKRTLQRRDEDIPRLVADRKQGKIAYFIMDKLVMRDKPPDRPRDGSDDQDDEVFIRDILIQDPKIQDPRSRNQDPEIKIPKSRSRNQDPEIKIPKSRSRNRDPEIKIQKSRSQNQDPEIKIQKSRS